MKKHMFIHDIVPCVFFYLLLTLAGGYNANAQCPASSPLVINSVTTTESRCQASGTATVSASGGSTPYTFSIIAGPTTSAAQSSNLLQSLAPGTYTLKVTDNCNTSVTSSFTVAGTYTIPSPTFTSQSTSCPGSSDGSLTVNLSGGRGPFFYALVSPSPITAVPQAGNVFTGLPAGSYTVQVTDSCGNFQTRTATIAAGSGGSVSISSALRYVACDSFVIYAYVYVTTDPSNDKPPYTVTLTLPDGSTVTQVLTSPTVQSNGTIQATIYFHFHHVTGNSDNLSLAVSNNCGASNYTNYPLSAYSDMSLTAIQPSGCGGTYSYTFDTYGDNSSSSQGLHCSTISYTLISPSGVILATQINNSTFSGYPAGSGYKVIRQDCCEKDSLIFDWASLPTLAITTVLPFTYGTCREGTASLALFFNRNNVNIVIASGPPSVTLADGTMQTFSYPDTLQNVSGGETLIGYVVPGTYKIYAIDNACNQEDSITTTIRPSDVRHSTFSASAIKGCAGGSSITVNVQSNTFLFASEPDGSITINSTAIGGITSSNFTESVTNQHAGNDYIAYHYQNPYAGAIPIPSGMTITGCDVLTDTVVVPGYTQPLFAASPAVANCGSVRDVALLPDSTSGVQPYQYQVISGPSTTSAQSSPVFPGLTAGAYTFQMTDACGNSYTRGISIDTLAVPNVTTNGGTCSGGAAIFTLPVSPFYSYTWRHPDGTTTTGDTLAFNPITNADTGTYNITVTSMVGGCTSTSAKTLTLGFCTVLQETLLHFNGQEKDGNIQLNWQTADQTGINYYVVEQSTDGLSFTTIQQLAATDAAQQTYTATDTHVPYGVVYYRLQMVGNYGALNYSQIISFNRDKMLSFNVYPRLVTGNTPLTCTYPGATNTGFIRLVGIDGRVYRTITVAAGSTTTSIDIAGLARGNYFVVFAGNDTVAATQVWKE